LGEEVGGGRRAFGRVFEAAVNDGAEELGAEEEVAEAGGVDGGAAGLLGGGICLLVLLLLLIVKKLLLVGVRLCARAPRASRVTQLAVI
jgi:hypothetical protein